MQEVLALAPDEASAKAARGLALPTKWPMLGANGLAVWGECQGSGSKPYQTQVDMNGPAFRCSCPSRKFPCKHGLALLMIQAQSPDRVQAGDAPPWVSQWLESRIEKAQKKEERQAERLSAAPVDPQVSARREEQRWQRLEAATQELQRWLADQLRAGLGSLGPSSRPGWLTLAARMVDAQAPGLGARIREAAAGIGQGEEWPERTLARLGLLQLVCDAMARRASLPPALQAELRTVVGWPCERTEVIEHGDLLSDRWTVLGVATQERDDRLTERRVWLHGQQTGLRALLLDHAFGGRGFEQPWLSGQGIDATVHRFPGSSGLRVLMTERRGDPAPACWPGDSLDQEWLRVARRVAVSPWVPLHPVVLPGAVPLRQEDRSWAVVGTQAWPLVLSDDDLWQLLSASAGHPVHLMGEWDGHRLVPLTAWSAEDPTVLWQGKS